MRTEKEIQAVVDRLKRNPVKTADILASPLSENLGKLVRRTIIEAFEWVLTGKLDSVILSDILHPQNEEST